MNWDEIRHEYETTSITLKALAEKHDIKLGTLKSRKSREGWRRDATKKVATNQQRDATPLKEERPVFVESEGLTDKQRLFCIYYVKSFNQTMAAIKAGYSPDRAHVTGSELVRNRKVADEIRRLKSEMQQGVFVDAMDVLNKYIQIAFADITDFATFGLKEVPVMNPSTGKPYLNDDGTEMTTTYNYVDFNESIHIDGTIVSEVKQGKEGISVKLADKMKALDMLSKYFDLLSENDKKKLQEEKLKVEIEKTKAETKNEEVGGSCVVIVNDKEAMRKAMENDSAD